MEITRRFIGYTKENGAIYHFRMPFSDDTYMEVSNYGATWVSAVVPDKDGKVNDVLLGYSSAEGYLMDTCYLGATVGRFANRIANAEFSLNGRSFSLDQNDGENSIHGGYNGFSRKLWDYEILSNGVAFSLFSPDGEGGFPGNLNVRVLYTCPDDFTLSITYCIDTDKDTYVNLTNHAYFNLSGQKDILAHKLVIPSSRMLEADSFYIPTGRMVAVEGTPFDFTEPFLLGSRIFEANDQLIWNKGYNHYYLLDSDTGQNLKLAAKLTDDYSGRQLEVKTTLPGVHLYTGNYLESILPGKNGRCYGPYEGVSLETQFPADAPNHANFPSCLLRIGEVYNHCTSYCFKNE